MIDKTTIKREKRNRRHVKIRARLSGTKERPRLSVFKSNRFMYAQLIDDDKSITLAHASTKDLKGKGLVEKAKLLGAVIAEKAKEKKIKKVVFDRAGFVYAGRIKALADSAREAGLVF